MLVLRKLFVLFGMLACVGQAVHAHDPGLSSSLLLLSEHSVEACVSFANSDVARAVDADRDGNGEICETELETGHAILLDFLAPRVGLWIDGVPALLEEIDVSLAENRDVVYVLRFSRPPGTRAIYEVRALGGLPRGHRQYAALQDARGQVQAEALLRADHPALRADISDVTHPRPMARGLRFLGLGVEHILIGYDHILFLLTLLLAVRHVKSALAIITSFTVAHSLTLVLASLDLVRLPDGLVESAIAASVVYVAVENIVRPEPRHRWRITFVFGLIHGFGFASVLRDLGVAEVGGLAIPLLSFNLGVELGQLAIAAVALPLIALLDRRFAFTTRATPALSCAVAVIGTWWLIERAFIGG